MKVIFFFMIVLSGSAYGQTKDELDKLTESDKFDTIIATSYKMALPRKDASFWDKDYASYKRFITPAMNKTQVGMSFTKDSVQTWMISNSVIPHAQLDTTTMIHNSANLHGIWRMIKHRNIRFTDSVNISDKIFYRTDTTLNDVSKSEEAFAIFSDKTLKIFSRDIGKSKFKLKNSTQYTLKNERSIILYNFSKASGVVGQIGIDENNWLILNFPAVLENKIPYKYNVYNTVIEQMIFEKVK